MITTTNNRVSSRTANFIKELMIVIPNCYYYRRMGFKLKTISDYATKHEFTDVLVVNERNKEPVGLYISHLPEGPTSYFRLTKLKLAQDMKDGTCSSTHHPEVVLNNFNTIIGHRIGRQFAALFPQRPEFRGRRVISFHNQRDFIFFRHHRYIFAREGKKANLREIGPRFTLKLLWIMEGACETKDGLYEFYWRPDMQVDRKMLFVG
eukprot:GHVU01188639.1.p1 GENE.GHVU01188639.1~~GHVU01188639.1.p1  ORF type:complete len:207 (+),score=21.54 GHVU01188639.1:2-622(+)